MSNKNELAEFYTSIIASCQPDFEGLTDPIIPEFASLLRNNDPLIPPGYAIDLGYGYGKYSLAMAQAGYEVDALDIIDSTILKDRLSGLAELPHIQIQQIDVSVFIPQKPYSYVVAKDMLHFLPRHVIIRLLSDLIAQAPPRSAHLLTLFCDIQRIDKLGHQIHVQGQADFSSQDLESLLPQLYAGWTIVGSSTTYSEPSFDPDVKHPYFIARKHTLTCQKGQG